MVGRSAMSSASTAGQQKHGAARVPAGVLPSLLSVFLSCSSPPGETAPGDLPAELCQLLAPSHISCACLAPQCAAHLMV